MLWRSSEDKDSDSSSEGMPLGRTEVTEGPTSAVGKRTAWPWVPTVPFQRTEQDVHCEQSPCDGGTLCSQGEVRGNEAK